MQCTYSVQCLTQVLSINTSLYFPTVHKSNNSDTLTKVQSTYDTSVCLDHWVICYGAPTNLMTNNGPSSSLSSSLQYVDTVTFYIWRPPPFISRPMVRWNGSTRWFPPCSSITWPNNRPLGSVRLITDVRLQHTRASFYRNDTVQSRIVSSPSGSCPVWFSIVDTDGYVNNARTPLIWWVLLSKLTTLRKRIKHILEKAQARYKHYFDKSICVTLTFLTGQYEFLDLLL